MWALWNGKSSASKRNKQGIKLPCISRFPSIPKILLPPTPNPFSFGDFSVRGVAVNGTRRDLERSLTYLPAPRQDCSHSRLISIYFMIKDPNRLHCKDFFYSLILGSLGWVVKTSYNCSQSHKVNFNGTTLIYINLRMNYHLFFYEIQWFCITHVTMYLFATILQL